jgi:hypothetical protein
MVWRRDNLVFVDISVGFLQRKMARIIYSYINKLSTQKKLFGKFNGEDGTVGRCPRAARIIWAAIFAAVEPLRTGGVWPASPLIAGEILRGAAAVAEQAVVSSQLASKAAGHHSPLVT